MSALQAEVYGIGQVTDEVNFNRGLMEVELELFWGMCYR
jgi:hypothetical protein